MLIIALYNISLILIIKAHTVAGPLGIGGGGSASGAVLDSQVLFWVRVERM